MFLIDTILFNWLLSNLLLSLLIINLNLLPITGFINSKFKSILLSRDINLPLLSLSIILLDIVNDLLSLFFNNSLL